MQTQPQKENAIMDSTHTNNETVFEKALAAFDTSTLDVLEMQQYLHHKIESSKADALQILINSVEGDYSQLSPALAKLAQQHVI